MDPVTIVAIAVGLSIDSFVVSLAGGATIRSMKFGYAARIALAFGLFQAMMPVAGWAAGITLEQYIKEYDHWVAFGLLAIIGGRMIWHSLSGKQENEIIDILKPVTLLLLAIATSIDALAIGISFALLDVSIIRPIIVIGLITFMFSLLGVYLGNRIGDFFQKKLILGGGVILILIGVKILSEHLVFT